MTQPSIRAAVLALALSFSAVAMAGAQEPGQQAVGRGQFAGMQRVTGEVTAVSGDALTVKAEDGAVYQVTTTANTRLMKSGASVKISDLKAGDGLMAAGNMDAANKTLHAAFVMATDAEVVKKMRANLGKTYISGKVTAIDSDNLKMTVLRPDGVAQTIGFDEGTSFKRGGRGMRAEGMGMRAGGGNAAGAGAPEGESITLADVKVGDNVMGQGSLKNGVFVPGTLMVAAPRQPRGARAGNGAAAAAGTAAPQ